MSDTKFKGPDGFYTVSIGDASLPPLKLEHDKSHDIYTLIKMAGEENQKLREQLRIANEALEKGEYKKTIKGEMLFTSEPVFGPWESIRRPGQTHVAILVGIQEIEDEST